MITREQIESLDEKIPGGFTPIDNLSFDDIADLKRLALLGLSMQWQPIETAPKVTTDCLVAFPWGDGHIIAVAYRSPDDGQWSTSVPPTHWMPLPEEPR